MGEPPRLRGRPTPHLPPVPLRSCPPQRGALRFQIPLPPNAASDYPPWPTARASAHMPVEQRPFPDPRKPLDSGPPLYPPCMCWTPWPPWACGPPQVGPLLPPPFSSGTSRKEDLASPPALVTGYDNFLSVYIRHLNHHSPLVCRTTRQGSSPPFGISIRGKSSSARISVRAVLPTPPTMMFLSPYATDATFPSTSPPQRSYPNAPLM